MTAVAIIGGGLSGLAAAVRLLDRGLAPTLFEASDRLGGLIRTVRQDGFLIECGADSFITSKPGGVAFCRRLGLEDRLVRPLADNRRSLIVRDGRPVPTPSDFHLCVPRNVRAVLESPLLSVAGKLRLLQEPAVPASEAADESLLQFASRRFGRETLDRIIQPICAGIYSADPDELSMAATMSQFPAMVRRHGSLTAAGAVARRQDAEAASGARYGLFATLPGGLQELVDAAASEAAAADVRIATAVHEVVRDGRQWRVDGETFDAVIFAVPARVAAGLLSDAVSDLAGIPFASSAIVVTGHRLSDIDHPCDAFGMIVPSTEERPVTAVSFASRKFAGRAPDGCVLLRTFVGGPHGRPLLGDEEACREAALASLGDLLGVRGEPLTSRVVPYPAASPQYTLGHLDRVRRVRAAAASMPGLHLAGASYTGVGIPDAIASGEAAADTCGR